MLSENQYLIVDLRDYFNADCISYDSNRPDGKFGMLTCLPAEELPESNSIFTVCEVPFLFPSKEDGEKNNIECYYQEIKIARGFYSHMYVLGGCDNGCFYERVKVGSKVFDLGLTDWFTQEPVFAEPGTIACTHAHTDEFDIDVKPHIWMQEIALDAAEPIASFLLPDNACLHILAVTFKRGERSE